MCTLSITRVPCAYRKTAETFFKKCTMLMFHLSQTNFFNRSQNKRISYIARRDVAVRIYLWIKGSAGKKNKKQINNISFNSWGRFILYPCKTGESVKFRNQSLAGAKLNLKCKWIWRSNILQALHHFNQAESRHWQSREVLEILNSPNASPNLD